MITNQKVIIYRTPQINLVTKIKDSIYLIPHSNADIPQTTNIDIDRHRNYAQRQLYLDRARCHQICPIRYKDTLSIGH